MVNVNELLFKPRYSRQAKGAVTLELKSKRYGYHSVIFHQEQLSLLKAKIEQKISLKFRTSPPFSDSLTEGTLIVDREDKIGWYLYLVDMLINEPHKYEYFQGSRVIPIFKRIGIDLESLKNIKGIEKRVRDLIKRRRHEADALLFEILTALLWAKNGYNVSFIEETAEKKTPDILAEKEGKI